MKHRFIKILFSSSLLTLSTYISANDIPEILKDVPQIIVSNQDFLAPDPIFKLPEDLTQWQLAASTYMEPLLETNELRSLWKQLLDLTMPSSGEFDPIDVPRREATIILSYNKMKDLPNESRKIYLEGLLSRHHHYVKQ